MAAGGKMCKCLALTGRVIRRNLGFQMAKILGLPMGNAQNLLAIRAKLDLFPASYPDSQHP